MNEYMYEKKQDEINIDSFLKAVFDKDTFQDKGLYFDEFCELAKSVTSEMFVAIYDCIY